MASRESMDHGDLLRNPNSGNEPLFVWNILSLLITRGVVLLGSLFRDWVCASARLLCTTLPTSLSAPCSSTNFGFSAVELLVPLLFTKHRILSSSSFPPLSHILIILVAFGSCSVPQGFLCLLPPPTHTQLYMQKFIATSGWSGSRSLVSDTPFMLDHH